MNIEKGLAWDKLTKTVFTAALPNFYHTYSTKAEIYRCRISSVFIFLKLEYNPNYSFIQILFYLFFSFVYWKLLSIDVENNKNAMTRIKFSSMKNKSTVNNVPTRKFIPRKPVFLYNHIITQQPFTIFNTVMGPLLIYFELLVFKYNILFYDLIF